MLVGSSQFLIMFATAPGAKATPGLLTKEFLRTLMAPVNEQSPQRIDELFMEVAKSVSRIGKQQEQPQEPWCHTGGLKRHFYFDVERNNAQVGTGQSYARVPADTPQTVLLSGEGGEGNERKQFGKYTLAGPWNERPYYRNADRYHLFYKSTGWCIDQSLWYASCCASISHFISC